MPSPHHERVLLRVLAGILVLLLVVLGGIVLFRNRLVEAVIVHVLETRTGCPVRIHGLSQGWGAHDTTIGDLEVRKPAGFPEGRALLLSKVRVRWSPRALFRGRLQLVELQTHLSAIERIQSKEGPTNLDRCLKAVETALDRGELKIDLLTLSLGEVRCTDEAKPDHDPLLVHGRGNDHAFTHLDSSEDFTRMIHTMVADELPSNAPGILGTTLGNAFKDFKKLF